jgi:hypothetical protein
MLQELSTMEVRSESNVQSWAVGQEGREEQGKSPVGKESKGNLELAVQ